MRKTTLFLLTCIAAMNIATAQTPKEQKIERIKALKVAYITEQLNLEPVQAEKFWPVYNKFEQEKWQMRKEFITKFKNDNPASTPHAAREYIDANLDYQEQELELKKKYKDELLKTITPEQLVQLYRSEKGFRQMLLKELHDRPAGKNKTP